MQGPKTQGRALGTIPARLELVPKLMLKLVLVPHGDTVDLAFDMNGVNKEVDETLSSFEEDGNVDAAVANGEGVLSGDRSV